MYNRLHGAYYPVSVAFRKALPIPLHRDGGLTRRGFIPPVRKKTKGLKVPSSEESVRGALTVQNKSFETSVRSHLPFRWWFGLWWVGGVPERVVLRRIMALLFPPIFKLPFYFWK